MTKKKSNEKVAVKTKPNIKLLENRILINLKKVTEAKNNAGIILPETAQEIPSEGIVILVGDGEENKPLVVKEGDRVFYSKNVGTEVTIDEEEYLIIREPDVVMIANEDGSVTPIGDRIIVHIPSDAPKEVGELQGDHSVAAKIRYQVSEKRASGIILVDGFKEKPKEKEPRGVIIAMGGGADNKKMPVKLGDEIFFGRFAGTDMKLKDKECKIIRQSDIILVLTGEAKIEDKTTVESQL